MVVPAALSAERLPAPATRTPRVSLALSLALHGLLLAPLLLAGLAGSNANGEPALLVELSLAAPTAGPEAEAKNDQPDTQQQQADEVPPEPQLPSVEETAAALPPPEPEPELSLKPEIEVELPPPQDPPPLKAAELKPPEPAKPEPAKPRAAPPKPAAARPAGQAAVTRAPDPDAGDASSTQQAGASPAPLIVFEGKPRYRHPPTPAVYPQRAIELNQQGEALVRVRLDTSGSAVEILLWRGSGFALLDRAALTAVRGWQFLPAIRDGRPVAAWVEIPVRFHLR